MNFSPLNFKIKNNIKIALLGSGSIATEHAKVIKSFDHKITLLITRKNSHRSNLFKKKFAIKNHILNMSQIKNHIKSIDVFVVAVPWYANSKVLLKLTKYNKPILIEKPIIFSLYNINKFKSLSKNFQEKIHISYNRNFYDFVPILINYLKKNKEFLIVANLSDTYKGIINKRGKKIKKYLLEYITSHWICFLFMLSKNLNMKLKIISRYN